MIFFLSACAHKPDINVSDTLGKSEVQLQKLDNVKITASSCEGLQHRREYEGDNPTSQTLGIKFDIDKLPHVQWGTVDW
ncbi:MAG TPA: hypothetical protein VFC58_05135 [Desulfosporosinus sp.]|nr:hypothetical protein [Desulfosporosinus sp.]